MFGGAVAGGEILAARTLGLIDGFRECDLASNDTPWNWMLEIDLLTTFGEEMGWVGKADGMISGWGIAWVMEGGEAG